MIDTIATVIDRNGSTLWQDALGVISLAIILVGVLHLPALI